MRIAFVNHSRRKIGGVETYLDSIIPAFAAEHEVAFLYESDASGRELISCPSDVPAWEAEQLGRSQTIHRLKQWKPDICFVHGLADTDLEAAIVALGNSALYVHNYYGSCISGNKMIVNGTAKPCERKFGVSCLAHYFPDHCGGSNPLTMLRLYQTQSQRLELMRRYRRLITNSEHMTREVARYGLASDCVYPFVRTSGGSPTQASFARVGGSNDASLRLIFSGRMTSLKGGGLLLEAAPLAQRALGRKLHISFCGDGPQRQEWQLRAKQLQDHAITFEFTGWLNAEQLAHRFADAHLHVMPSVWPEPFGLSGLEAGTFGVPSVAFAVGGVPEWLHDGVNGHLASSPSTAENLAEAITRALADEAHYEQLRAGAIEAPQRYPLQAHVSQLLNIFDRCAG
jgi:glycosyltransferase involved in cell wall biosynthesis